MDSEHSDTGGGSLVGDGAFRRIVLRADNKSLSLLGPTKHCCYIDVIEDGHQVFTAYQGRHEKIHDAELCGHFDRGMEAAPWLDWLAERNPDLAWAATLYGKLMAGAADG